MIHSPPSKTHFRLFLEGNRAIRSRKGLVPPTSNRPVYVEVPDKNDAADINKDDNYYNNIYEEDNGHLVAQLLERIDPTRELEPAHSIFSRDTSGSSSSKYMPGLIVAIVVSSLLGTFLFIYLYMRRKKHTTNIPKWQIISFPGFRETLKSRYKRIRRRTRDKHPLPMSPDFRINRHRYAIDTLNPLRSSTFIGRESPGTVDDEVLKIRSITYSTNAPSSKPEIKGDNENQRDSSMWIEKLPNTKETITAMSTEVSLTQQETSTLFDSPMSHRPIAPQAGFSKGEIKKMNQSVKIAPGALSTASSFPIQSQPQPPQTLNKATLPESSWLLLSPSDDSDSLNEISRTPTISTINPKSEVQTLARSSLVTIPSYYYNYHRKYLSQANSRAQSQYYPESIDKRTLASQESGLNNSKDIHKWADSYIREGKQPNANSLYLEDDDKDIDIHAFYRLPNQPSQAAFPAAKRNRSLHGSRHKHKKRHTVSSIATVSTATIFKQHPGDEVDLGSSSRVGRIRSSLLSGISVQ